MISDHPFMLLFAAPIQYVRLRAAPYKQGGAVFRFEILAFHAPFPSGSRRQKNRRILDNTQDYTKAMLTLTCSIFTIVHRPTSAEHAGRGSASEDRLISC